MDSETAPKRARASHEETSGPTDGIHCASYNSSVVLKSMSVPVSPPRKRRREEVSTQETTEDGPEGEAEVVNSDIGSSKAPLRSPFQLTSIRDLAGSANVDTLTVRDVFGSPHVVECWEFNYLHNLDFLMSAFDEGALQRGLAVHVVHGFWKREDPRRASLEAAARQYQGSSPNSAHVTLHTAFLPEPFGTHHTKMAVLFRDDGTAQVVIHTANLIPHDWANMTQAVWRSPLLPLLGEGARQRERASKRVEALGAGSRFKRDLLNYFRAYDRGRTVCRSLVDKLARYDFSAVRAVLIGSVPGRHDVLRRGEEEEAGDDGVPTQWGWAAVKHALQHVPVQPAHPATAGISPTGTKSTTAEVVMQVSSIATLGGNDSWLRQSLFDAFSGGKLASSSQQLERQQKASFGSLRVPQQQPAKPQFHIVFPVADEIRRSLDGYVSGTSIHTKIQSPQQQRQLEYMRPLMCHWANDVPDGEPLPPAADAPRCDAGRKRAAPHVKTYVRYGQDGSIDWALMTSANLSKQAWGEAKSMMGEVRIASYELGVLVWPELLAEGAKMQPVFGRDTFTTEPVSPDSSVAPVAPVVPVVPLRIPYSLPLQRYGKNEVPWVGTMSHEEPDWRGVRWQDD